MAQENVMKFIEMMQENEEVQAQLGHILNKGDADEDVTAIPTEKNGRLQPRNGTTAAMVNTISP